MPRRPWYRPLYPLLCLLLLLAVALGGCASGEPVGSPAAPTATTVGASGAPAPTVAPTATSAPPPPTPTTAPTSVATPTAPPSATSPAPSPTPLPTPPPTPSPAPSPSPTPADPEITLAAVGDLMLARSLGAALERDPTDSPLAGVAPTLRAADVTVGNLECALGTAGRPAPKAYTFQGPPAAIDSLTDAGFDILSLANNHILDYGVAGLRETVALLDGAGIRHTGAGLDERQAHRPALLTVKGLKLAFLAYVNVPLEGGGYNIANWEATGDEPGVAWAEPGRIATDVAAARRDADLVIVLLHSGNEEEDTPNAIQRAAAYAAIDAGAALVLGAHPHTLQGIERYNGGIIAYSLGNFVFDGFEGTANESAILTLTLTRAGVRSFTWTPVLIVDGRPELAEGRTAQAILARLERLSAALDR